MEVRDFRIALKTRQDINYQEPVFAINEDLSLLYEEAKILAHTYNKKTKKKPKESLISQQPICMRPGYCTSSTRML